ncbi:MAG: response regulator [Actinomycetota bacterium]|nr:response regulator [Actinomycetota bacterium]
MSGQEDRAGAAKLKVVVVDDDAFITSLVSDGLRAQGFAVATALTTAEAWDLIAREAPHALVSDLNFGPGESAAALLNRVHDEFPWVGLVVLTAHQSPELAIEDAGSLPPDVIYLVKTQMKRVEDLGDAVMRAISGAPASAESPLTGTLPLTAAQANVLRMLADGASTRSIAEHRGTSIRAAETMLSRLYAALGLESDELSNPRVVAVRLWQQGRVTIQTSDRTDP